MITGEEVVELLPALAAREPTSGYLFYDCQTDDARLVLTVLGEAERFGAVCANRLDVTGLLEQDGRASGVQVRDLESGAEFEVRAPNVVNATGVWADQLRPQELHVEAELPRIRPSRGTHITISTPSCRSSAARSSRPGAGARSSRCPGSGTRSSARPTTTTRARSSTSSPRARTSTTCSTRSTRSSASDFGPDRLTGAFAGVRPLISTGDPKKSVDISRKAELYETSSGMITITGGKLTTWRRMAKMTVDRLVEREAREAPCRTHEIPLGQAIAAEELPRVEGVAEDAYAALAARYGHAALDVLAIAAERGELAQPIVAGLPDLLAEVALAARREQARSIGDVLLRRTRLGLLAARELGRTAARPCGASARCSRASSAGTSAAWRGARAFAARSAAEGIAPGAAPGPPEPAR